MGSRLLVTMLLGTSTACASARTVTYKVTSIPPLARVELNGVSVGQTPAKIELQCKKRWVGFAYSSDGWEYTNSVAEIVAFPPSGSISKTQVRQVNACQHSGQESARIVFEFEQPHTIESPDNLVIVRQ